MLPKKHRLSKTADVNLTTAKGRSFFSQSFLIKSFISEEIKTAQITVVASVKVSKNAVIRNRIKRIIRQGLHDFVSKIKPGYYVFVVKKSAVLVQPQQIRDELVLALKKNKMI